MRAVHVVGGGPAGVMAAFAAMRDSSSTVGDAKFPQLVDSTRGDAFHSEILVSQIIHK